MARLEIGQLVKNRYRVDEYIDSGGMADVYKVFDISRRSIFAMKVMKADLAEDREFIRRFLREAKNLTNLKHPNIVRLYDYGQEGSLVFMVVEYIDGRTLKKEIFNEKVPLPPCKVQLIMEAVCNALHYSHQSGFVHCDVKPANIMINRRGDVFLTDFGIARNIDTATITMAGFGAPAYMSPEQIAGKPPRLGMDVYSLGVTLYEMLAGGRRPFNGDRAQVSGTVSEKVRWEQRNLKPLPLRSANPNIPLTLEDVVMRCLEKEPDRRFKDTMELLEALHAALPVIPQNVLEKCLKQGKDYSPPPPLPSPWQRNILLWVRQNPIPAIVAAGALIGIAILVWSPPFLTIPTPRPIFSRTITPKPTNRPINTPTRTNPTRTADSGNSVIDQSCRIAYAFTQNKNTDIYFISIYGGSPNRLTSSSGNDKQPDWSPDARQIVFVSDRDGDDEIWIMDADGSNQKQLTFNNSGDGMPHWSPDGEKIVFHSNLSGDYEIFVMDRDGNNQTQLTYNDARDQQPSWSPDGKLITFVSNRSGDNDIWLMDLDGKNLEQLTSSSRSDGMPSWSSDGQFIVFHSDRDGDDEIFRISVSSGQTRQLTSNNSADRDPSWSPDGLQIAFDSNRDGKDNFNIYLMNPDGTSQYLLIGNRGNEYQPAWSPFCK